MLKKVLIPLNLHESKDRLSEMAAFLKTLGTDTAVLLHVGADTRSAGEHHRRQLTQSAEWFAAIGYSVETALRPGSVRISAMLRDRKSVG